MVFDAMIFVKVLEADVFLGLRNSVDFQLRLHENRALCLDIT